MQPVAEFKASHPNSDVETLLKTSPEADIGALIDLTMQSDRDAVAVVENGAIVGVVTTRGLLRGVAGTPVTAAAAAA
jgi:glycine betaine/proline transport system ATP-binding protein